MTSKRVHDASLADLLSTVLRFDYNDDIFDDRARDRSKAQQARRSVKPVTFTFEDSNEYTSVLRPLFLEELKGQLQRAKSTEEIDLGKSTLEKFEYLSPAEVCLRFSVGTVALNQVFRGDLCVIDVEHGSSRLSRLAYTLHVSRPGEGSFVELLAFCLQKPDGISLDGALLSDSKWHVRKLTSMATSTREYHALYEFFRQESCRAMWPYVLNKADEIERVGSKFFSLPAALWTEVTSIFNESQVEAIRECRKRSGLTLIQGPPGTGKTTTILGIISVLLSCADGGRITGEVDGSTNGGPLAWDPTGKLLSSMILGGQLSADETMDASDSDGRSSGTSPEPRPLRTEWVETWFDDVPCDALPGRPQANIDPSLDKVYPRSGPVVDMSELVNRSLFSSGDEEFGKKRRILVCAPSNAAVDEVVRRLTTDGIWDASGAQYVPSIVRLGPNIHPALAAYSLDGVVAAAGGVAVLSPAAAIKAASVVCCTLSVAGSADLRQYNLAFSDVIIDEASQAVEISTLIPLTMGCRRLVLVGDHKQLPATIFSETAFAKGYSRSLFERLHSSGNQQALVLKQQLRMHPEIASVVSELFYEGQIEDSPLIDDLVGQSPYTDFLRGKLGPVAFFDIVSSKTIVENKSLQNLEEADFIELLVTRMLQHYETLYASQGGTKFEDSALGLFLSDTAVISPYSQQVKLLTSRLSALVEGHRKAKHPSIAPNSLSVEVSTVDSFQGREKNCIIVSTVRSDPDTGLGFLADSRRLNVLLSRAKQNLWMVGHHDTLRVDKTAPWSMLLDQLAEKNRIFTVKECSARYFDSFS